MLMESLFSKETAPLADRMRPKNLKDFVGQEHLIGPKGMLTKLLKSAYLPSLIFWGPPGSGKTTLARLLSDLTESTFISLSAVSSGINEVKKVVEDAKTKKEIGQKTILFIDEIHRFNKAQQDAFLPWVENGTITLIGATTENPSFEVISPLLSRCRTVILKELSEKALKNILNRALKKLDIKIDKDAEEILIHSSGGDARLLLNTIEIASTLINNQKNITKDDILNALQHRAPGYDKSGEGHFNTISAFIKSMRGSNADAALYYLARMLDAGEDPLYIARRIVVFASEDVGLADAKALLLATACFEAVEKVGLPEAAINLSHVTCYLALTKKSRASYDAFQEAKKTAKEFPDEPIPMVLRNAPTKLMKDLGYGTYKWPGHPGFAEQELMPERLKGRKFLYYKKKQQ